MLKGIAVNTVIKLVLAVMVAALVISITTTGPLGQALEEAFESIGDATDRRIEIENNRQMSDLTMFVKDRALNKGCKKVEQVNNGDESELHYPNPAESDWNGGYKGLEGSYLTQYPECYGGDASVAFQGADGVSTGGLGADDNFMPGIYSRENFKITSDFKIEEGKGQYYLDNNIGGVIEGNRAQFKDRLNDEGLDISCSGFAWAATALDRRLGVLTHSTCIGYEALNEKTQTLEPIIIMEKGDMESRSNLAEGVSKDTDVEFQFCEGDEGYIQSSRGSIDNDGHSSEEPLIPMIVIEEIGSEECGTGADRFEPYNGPKEANQIYVKSKPNGLLGNGWPEADEFELRAVGERGPEEDDWIRNRVGDDLPENAVGGENLCEINYRTGRVASTLETYPKGIVIESNQENFGQDLGPINTSHTLTGTETEYPATDLIDEMSLDGSTISNPDSVGELRPKNNVEGVNRLYGDLLCANPDSEEYAKWHLCSEDREGETITTQESPTISWKCESGEWEDIS